LLTGISEFKEIFVNRKAFFKKAAQACLAGGGTMLLKGQEAQTKTDKAGQERRAREFEKRFKEAYILTLMENMEKQLDEKTRTKLMEDCGRACARRGGMFKMAQECRGNVKKFIEISAGQLGKENVFLDGDTVHWGYPRCFCELVAEGPARLPGTYCRCSVGWVLEMFETVAQKPVKVDLVQSVKQGAPSCQFLVRL